MRLKGGQRVKVLLTVLIIHFVEMDDDGFRSSPTLESWQRLVRYFRYFPLSCSM
jgi:hypothetical protein